MTLDSINVREQLMPERVACHTDARSSCGRFVAGTLNAKEAHAHR